MGVNKSPEVNLEFHPRLAVMKWCRCCNQSGFDCIGLLLVVVLVWELWNYFSCFEQMNKYMRLEIKVIILEEKRFKHGIEERGKEPCIVIKSIYIKFPFKIR